jgi:hypothetical protein
VKGYANLKNLKIMDMKQPLKISAIIDKPDLIEDMVEKLADRRVDIGYSHAMVPQDLKAIDTSSTETYVSGTVAIEFDNEKINMPFITCFLFTCIKGKKKPYQLEWATSLS